jgi:hypothetical protein
MRDRGFDFRWADKYASNDYAIGLNATDGEQFACATAFEVFEHLTDPRAELGALLERAGAVLFSTTLLPYPTPMPGEWWYYALFGGQHIQLDTRDGLVRMGRDVGAELLTTTGYLHLYYRGAPPLSRTMFRLLAKGRVARLANRIRRRPSLQAQDFARFIQEFESGARERSAKARQ